MECLHARMNVTVTSEASNLTSDFPVSSYRTGSIPNDGLIRDPSYLRLWDFEKGIDQDSWAKWHNENWQLALISSAIYLATIFGIKGYMRTRTPFTLQTALFLWNSGLAIFSIFGFFRSAPELEFVLGKPGGVHDSICRRDQRNAATAFWGVVFGLSKIVELGDTVFIVLRKQPLIFLHYYHHVTVLSYTFLTAYAINSTCVWFGVMNYGIHSLMYSYYALKALQVKIPKSMAMTITLLQLAQMVFGVGINVYVLVAKHRGLNCSTETSHVYYALLMYGSYFLLFAKFFHRAYLRKKNIRKLE